jgi:hypothetical protein
LSQQPTRLFQIPQVESYLRQATEQAPLLTAKLESQ